MSASSKKKLRKELEAAAMTEKQLLEQKESKKLRLYTGIFAAIIAVMILVVAYSRISSTGIIPRSTTAVTVGGTKVSAAELNHYYIDSINNFLNSYGDYVSLFGLDTTKALDEQYYNESEGQTWSDYFLETATASVQNMYAVYNAAQAEGFQLSQESKDSIDDTIENLALYAVMYGFSSTDSYIAAMYGNGCNEETYRQYAEVQMTAQEYANAKNESLTYDDAALRAEESENYNAYSSFSYNYVYLAASSFYEGGTTDEDGNTTYSDEEKEAGRAAAEAAAATLAASTTAEELDAAIAALELTSTTASTRYDDQLYSSVSSVLSDWVTGDRKSGDITVIPSESTTHNHAEGEECTGDDGTTVVNGYYVVLFDSKNDNLTNLVNVRHILVAFEGGTTDETTGSTTYSDEEKDAAKTEAEALLASFRTGEATEDAFAALANENSDDGDGTTGGLYENVYPGQMVTNFNDWCFDASRKPGDTGVIESEYGYHVMYFVGTADTTYRDYMIESTLRNEDLTAWETGLIEAAELVVSNTKFIKTDLTLSSST